MYNSVRNPFESTNSREDKIKYAAPLLFFIIFIEWSFHSITGMKTVGEDPLCGEFRFNYMLDPGEILIETLYLVSTLYVLWIVFKGLSKKGLNKEIKKTFLQR